MSGSGAGKPGNGGLFDPYLVCKGELRTFWNKPNANKMKLIKMLRMAHAIEIGAYNAYEGHWRSIADTRPEEAKRIVWIQAEERTHKLTTEHYLRTLNAEPSKVLDSILWVIGKTISTGCHVFGYRMAMWGAKVMEVLGSDIYRKLAAEALRCGDIKMSAHLWDMNKAEREHEKFFESMLSR